MTAAPIRTDRLILRRPMATDLPIYTAYCGSDRSKFVGGPFDAVRAFEKFASLIGHWELRGFGRFILTEATTGRPMGHVGPMQMFEDEVPEMTWTLWNDSDEGQGFATEAARGFLDHGTHLLAYPEMIIRIEAGNRPSQRLADRIGARLDPFAEPPPWMADGLTYRLSLPAPQHAMEA